VRNFGHGRITKLFHIAWILISDPIAVKGSASKDRSGARLGRHWSKALLTVVFAAVGSISLLTLGGLAATPAAAASGAPAVSQCNPPDFPRAQDSRSPARCQWRTTRAHPERPVRP